MPCRCLHRSLVVLLLVLAIGGHWAVLQSFAWARMIVAYSRDRPMTEAIRMTFDGNHPCPLCKQIAKARQEERRQAPAARVEAKLDFSLPQPRAELPGPPCPHRPPAALDARAPVPLPQPPPKPPPRPVAAG